jgi:hypothetical protein
MPVGVGNLVRKPNITEPVIEIIGKKSTSSKPDISCQYMKLIIFLISYRYKWYITEFQNLQKCSFTVMI